jgi:superfamily II DNA or RNA helicase
MKPPGSDRLDSLELKTEYRTGEDDLVQDFYRPCLSRAKQYDRAVGNFRSTVFAITADIIVEFAKAGGRIRVVCSPSLTDTDIQAAIKGYRGRAQIVERAIERDVDALLGRADLHDCATVLATLIRVGCLNLRVAYRSPTEGPFHEKVGVFLDRYSNQVTFKGSSDETWSGWSFAGNLESFEVFCSWRAGLEEVRVGRHRAYFDRLWTGELPHVLTISFPERAKAKLLAAAKPSLEELRAPRARLREQHVPLPHQVGAISNWEEKGRRGILEHATGSGKTLTAILALDKHLKGGGVGLVLVPSRLLHKQWAAEIARVLPDVVTLSAGAGHHRWREAERLERFSSAQNQVGRRVILATMRTSSTEEFRRRLEGGDHLMVVADEVHQLGSRENLKVLEIPSGARLGLSATPQRYGDPEGTQQLMEYFGGVVLPRVTLEDAIKSGRLVEYEYFPHPVHLRDREAEEWKRLTRLISHEICRQEPRADGSVALSERAKLLLIQRSRIAKRAAEKIPLAVRVISAHFEQGQRWLVYCEDVEQLAQVRDALAASGRDTLEYHTAMTGDQHATLRWFRQHGGILVSIRCLDEGVDIPDMSHALVLASSQNPRQFIQRRGRVLRTAPGKSVAVIHDAIVVPITCEDEPEQTTLARTELRRAIRFADSALNRFASAELREIAKALQVMPDERGETGIEEEPSDE